MLTFKAFCILLAPIISGTVLVMGVGEFTAHDTFKQKYILDEQVCYKCVKPSKLQ